MYKDPAETEFDAPGFEHLRDRIDIRTLSATIETVDGQEERNPRVPEGCDLAFRFEDRERTALGKMACILPFTREIVEDLPPGELIKLAVWTFEQLRRKHGLPPGDYGTPA